jgi:hypothetical protein
MTAAAIKSMDIQLTEQYEYDEEGDVLDVYFGEKRPAMDH